MDFCIFCIFLHSKTTIILTKDLRLEAFRDTVKNKMLSKYHRKNLFWRKIRGEGDRETPVSPTSSPQWLLTLSKRVSTCLKMALMPSQWSTLSDKQVKDSPGIWPDFQKPEKDGLGDVTPSLTGKHGECRSKGGEQKLARLNISIQLS